MNLKDALPKRSHSRRLKDELKLIRGRVKCQLQQKPRSLKIFVLGTGRSGTHWLGDIMSAHPSIAATVEKPPAFTWVVELAMQPEKMDELFPKLVRRYRYEHADVEPRHFLDKSHPSLWIADAIAEAFPEAMFVAIRRDVFGTVNSMLQHEGVMRWIHGWTSFPLPNRFLGITPETAEAYAALPLEGKCAVRWKAHMQQLDRLGKILGPRLLELSYDNLQTDTAAQLERIANFLELGTALPLPNIKRRSLARWREELTATQQSNIEAAVERFPVDSQDGSRLLEPAGAASAAVAR
ncbi:MAG: sulfotransferase [Kiloniellaceae bacterium]|nr:sulfotransferase [Kiloniellaceae bacterium]